jgi:hypothetical protein
MIAREVTGKDDKSGNFVSVPQRAVVIRVHLGSRSEVDRFRSDKNI